MSLRGNRYACALAEIAGENLEAEIYRQDLYQLSELFKTNEDLRNLMQNPAITTAVKKNVLSDIFAEKISGTVNILLQLLTDKNALALLPDISDEFSKLADEMQEVLKLEITSAETLGEDQLNLLLEKYRNKYGVKSIKAVLNVDKNVLGGISVKVGDRLTDGTLAARLENLRRQMLK